MSRVFLAEETRLSRQVVIKVLPPEMGAGVNAERFEREIRVAARLQHPHIVPLLTAGASGDLLYYIMPYIAGESLRARLIRQGELPVGEAVRITRELVDALAYAHRNGVVHRDIKPENVLMSEGHAVVTDFGVAKAVSASSGGQLTSLGLALGTPAYMAPEQAAADPHVDHRADLYSIGVVAYEMLAGRTPFAAASPQAMLAAHITQAPDPLEQHRRSVPPALSAVVMRCLEKHAADRWQSATEVSAQLESIPLETSGGHAPTGAQPAASSGTEAAIRRGHPLRVTALFLAASAGVLGLTYFLVQRLGLPDWVFTAAVALLLLGLPIMVLAGLQERRRARARTGDMTVATPAGLAPWTSWRRAMVGGAMAFAGLGVLATGYTAMRLLGIGPVGTLVASGVLEEREPLILADFENRTPDSTLGQSLTEAFRVDLSQSPTLRLVDPGSLVETLERMERRGPAALNPALAREVAERMGVKAVVVGQIDPVGRGYVLSASLVGAGDGRILTAVRESAEDEGSLLRAIDQLSRKLRERIGESLTTIRADPPLEDVTTGSLAALRKYTAANRLIESDRGEEAVPLLEEAVALDTGFAMAWRKLAVIMGNFELSPTREAAAATRAYEHRDRLPAIERNLTVGYYHGFVSDDPAKVVAAYRAVLEIDPDNYIALNNLAIALTDQRRFVEAESLALRTTRFSPGSPGWLNTVQAQLAQGKQDEARATLEVYRRQAPASPWPELLSTGVALAARDFDSAESRLLALRARKHDSQFFNRVVRGNLAILLEQRGRIAEARRMLDERLQVTVAERLPWESLRTTSRLARLDAMYGRDPRAGAATLKAGVERTPLGSLAPHDRPYVDLISAYVAVGQLDEARRLHREYESQVPETMRRTDLRGPSAAGAVAAASGETQRALALYREWYERDGNCFSCGSYEMGQLFDRLGQPDSAIAAYSRVVGATTLDGLRFAQNYSYAPSLKRLGELYEGRGDRAKAADYYGRFVELWKHADPELQPTVKEVRTRLAQLSQEPGG